MTHRLDGKPAIDRAEVVLKRYLSTALRVDEAGGCPLPAIVGEIGTTAEALAEPLAVEVELIARELETHVTPTDRITGRHLALGVRRSRRSTSRRSTSSRSGTVTCARPPRSSSARGPSA